jgi:hypothetical protein
MPWKMKKHKTDAESVKPAKRLTADYGLAYQQQRDYILKTRPICENKGTDCTGFASECHHLRYGSDLTLADYMSVCYACHKQLEREKNNG